jgi:spore coat protein U-like protein
VTFLRAHARICLLGVVGAVLCAPPEPSQAATTTATFTAQIIIQASCLILSPGNLDFGTAGALAANVDATAAFQVQCTNTTPYNVGLNAGTTGGGTVATRKMTSGSATVDYRMYTDAARTTNWGDTVGVDTVSNTGTGAAQSFTVYGRVPAQPTPAPATYTDTVTITVTY